MTDQDERALIAAQVKVAAEIMQRHVALNMRPYRAKDTGGDHITRKDDQ